MNNGNGNLLDKCVLLQVSVSSFGVKRKLR